MSYLKMPNPGWDGIVDTGLGDRMRHWTYAYKLNEINNFIYTILVDDYKWRELKYLDFPYTEQAPNVNSNNSVILDDKTHPHKHIYGSKAVLPSRSPELYFGRLTRHTHKGDTWTDSTKAKEVADKDWFVGASMELDSDIISLIKLKDDVLEDKIKELVKDRIGIHIRHWPNHDSDQRPDKVKRFNYIDKMKLVRKTLDTQPFQKFYISSNVTYDRPATGPILPNFRMESHWLSEVYRDYDVIDYRDVIPDVDIMSMLPGIYNDKLNPKWSKVFDDEGREIRTGSNVEAELFRDNKVMYIEDLYDTKVLRDIVDIFSLIHSKEFISSDKTGPHSSWSEFVEVYRKNI